MKLLVYVKRKVELKVTAALFPSDIVLGRNLGKEKRKNLVIFALPRSRTQRSLKKLVLSERRRPPASAVVTPTTEGQVFSASKVIELHL
jgi:hypothetical protein